MSSDTVRNPFIDPASPSRNPDHCIDSSVDATDLDGDEVEDIPAAMTESYSEIAYTQNFFSSTNVEEQLDDGAGSSQNAGSASSSSSSSQTRKRPDSLNCDKRKGVVQSRICYDHNFTMHLQMLLSLTIWKEPLELMVT